MFKNGVKAPYVRLLKYGERDRMYASMLMQMDIALDLIMTDGGSLAGWRLFREASERLAPVWRKEETTTPEVWKVMRQSVSFLTKRAYKPEKGRPHYNLAMDIVHCTISLIPDTRTPEKKAEYDRLVRNLTA